jgi:sulfite reductase (ferredoxin)
MSATPPKPTSQERIKQESHGLRGEIAADLANADPWVSDASYELLKFHGTYQGYDRDTATPRKQQGLEKEYEFMVRLKMPGGRLSAAQYLAMDALADQFANGSLRITSRETFQFHCVVKEQLKPLIAAVNRELLSTLGGCGDVVRNIMTCPSPEKNAIQSRLQEDVFLLARHLAPRTGAYVDIWLDGEPVEGYPFAPESLGEGEEDPLYGSHYMPRKFKIGIARAEDNCIDVLSHDLAILPLFDGDRLQGYNFALGGGMGMTHNNPATYPRLATPIAFLPPDALIAGAEAVVKLQRDFGDRTNRRHARLKYVVAERGLDWTKNTLDRYMGRVLDAPKPMRPFAVEEHMGWHPQGDGKWFLGLVISSGRITDREEAAIRTGLREVIRTYQMPLVLTADQNIILCDIEEGERQAVEAILSRHGIALREVLTPTYRHFLACVALPTCGKALAEAERVKLPLVAAYEEILTRHGLREEPIKISMSGCPHGCSRPYTGEIGIVGRTPEHYTLYVGGNATFTRLNQELFDKVPFAEMPLLFEALIVQFKASRQPNEGLGDFLDRTGVEGLLGAITAALGAGTYKWLAA